jgi:hypothetical protein
MHYGIAMKIGCTLEFFYEDEKKARDILESVDVDNYGFVNASVQGSKLVSKIEAKNLQSLLHTLEDYLSCISIAERITEG